MFIHRLELAPWPFEVFAETSRWLPRLPNRECRMEENMERRWLFPGIALSGPKCGCGVLVPPASLHQIAPSPVNV